MIDHEMLPSERISRISDFSSDDSFGFFFAPTRNRPGRKFTPNDPFADQFLRDILCGHYAARKEDEQNK
jgi:hypothetical protein